MGHVRLGTLPRTRSWHDVVGFIADGETVESVANQALAASDKAFGCIQNDPGFWRLSRISRTEFRGSEFCS